MITLASTEGAGQRQEELELRSALKYFFFFQAPESTTTRTLKPTGYDGFPEGEFRGCEPVGSKGVRMARFLKRGCEVRTDRERLLWGRITTRGVFVSIENGLLSVLPSVCHVHIVLNSPSHPSPPSAVLRLPPSSWKWLRPLSSPLRKIRDTILPSASP